MILVPPISSYGILLCVGIDKSSFTKPAASDREIYVFADAPHLIKLIRNNFLDSGFVLGDGKFVLSGCVREIIFRSIRDLKTTHHLSEKHVSVTGVKRTNVRLAVQLLFETTAKSLEYFGQRGLLESKYWEDTSQFISLADSWFDLLN